MYQVPDNKYYSSSSLNYKQFIGKILTIDVRKIAIILEFYSSVMHKYVLFDLYAQLELHELNQHN